jgi:uncharacterized protein
MPENKLAQSSSAYLRSASHQPIEWYEFGDEAFEKAKALDRLIFLDIGAVWCHWCHVIDRESYENNEIAKLINDNYVAVKVDRDQRPDIDARYQQVVASMTGQGGWPLTAFLTHDGRVLFGGTYFPPDTMKKLLNQIKGVYETQKEEIMQETLEQSAPEEVEKVLQASEAEEAKHPIPRDVFGRIVKSARDSYDPVYGGFGIHPKFPHFSTLEFLIQQYYFSQDPDLREIIDKTLTGMADGGIYDHIGGGFHRYSVDRQWHVPHFEKMAYDNAEALKVYAQAYRMFGNPKYLDVVDGILRFTAEVLSDPDKGGFYASQDADIDLNDDGDYFTWTMDDVKAVLTPEEAALAIPYYDINAEGDMHERPGRNVLRVQNPLSDYEARLDRSAKELEQQLQTAKRKLAESRITRTTPFIDNTVYLNWNGMLLTGYFEAADLLDKPEVRQYAQKTLDRLLETHVDIIENILLHVAGVSGMLEDYAWMIQALIKGYQSTEESRYLEAARHWAEVARSQFEDTAHGGFFDIPAPTGRTLALLKFRRKPTEDTPSSSANAVMSRSLVDLYLITGEESYLQAADRTFKMFGHEFTNRGIYISSMAIGLFEHLNSPAKLEIVGTDPALKAAARTAFFPGKVVVYTTGKTSEIRICQGSRCIAPLTDTGELEAQLKALLPRKAVTP